MAIYNLIVKLFMILLIIFSHADMVMNHDLQQMQSARVHNKEFFKVYMTLQVCACAGWDCMGLLPWQVEQLPTTPC